MENSSNITSYTNQTDSSDRIEKTQETHYMSASILVMLALMVINTILHRITRNLRSRYTFCARYIQDAFVPTLVGIFAGIILKTGNFKGVLDQIRDGYQSLFMIVLLPPIIFESAISLDKKQFFYQFGSIISFAVGGTFIAILVTGFSLYLLAQLGLAKGFGIIECLAFGAVISSTDPVSVLSIFKEMNANKILYSLIFGESILNDALTVTLYRIISSMYFSKENFEFIRVTLIFCGIFFGSILIGWVIGMACALVLKLYFKKSQADIPSPPPEGSSDLHSQENTEALMMILVPWCAYLIGEGLDMSGIVTLMFCGISMSKYCFPNLSRSGRRLTNNLYLTLSATCETMVFLFIGLGFFSFNFSFSEMGIALFIAVFLIINAARIFQIKLLSKLLNMIRDRTKITTNFQNVMIYSGFRGAMAFALATNAKITFLDNRVGDVILLLTLLYAVVTIFLQGVFLVPVLEHYGVANQASGEEDSAMLITDNNCYNSLKKKLEILDRFIILGVVRTDALRAAMDAEDSLHEKFDERQPKELNSAAHKANKSDNGPTLAAIGIEVQNIKPSGDPEQEKAQPLPDGEGNEAI